jgi:small conductance mechanosensitive channel
MNALRFLLLSLALLAGPALAQDGAISTANAVTATSQAETDAAIATRIRDIIHELDGYEDVTVSVKAGIVTLRGTTLDATLVEELDTLVGRVDGVVAIENKVTLSTSVTKRLQPVRERLVARAQQAVAFLPLVAVALVAFALVVWIGFFIGRREQPWDRLAPNAFIADIFRTLVKLAAIIAGLVVALDILGATALLSTILGAAGIVGLAIGFAVQDTVENFIASLLLSIRQPFRPNDAIEINGDEGKVIRLTSRATILLSWDGNQIRIPNSTVFKSRIVNYSRNPERRFKFDLGVAYGTDLTAAKALAEATVAALPFVLKTPAANSWLGDLGGSSVAITVVGWIDQRETDLLAARSEAIRQVLIAFAQAGIELPEPTYRLLTSEIESAPDVAHLVATPVPDADQVTEVQDVAASAEPELEDLVNAERREKNADDLLRSNSRDE